MNRQALPITQITGISFTQMMIRKESMRSILALMVSIVPLMTCVPRSAPFLLNLGILRAWTMIRIVVIYLSSMVPTLKFIGSISVPMGYLMGCQPLVVMIV